MGSKRTFRILLGIVIALLVLIIGGAYGTTNLLKQRSLTLANLKAKDQQLDQKQTQLKKAKQDVATYKPLADIAKSIVPQDKDQAEAVRQIVKIAQASGINLAQFTFPTSTLGNSAAAPKSTANPRLSQLTPVKGIPGVYDLQIVIQNSTDHPVPYSGFLDFLSRLERNRRTSQVNSINLQPDPKNPSLLSFTLTIDEYIKP